MSYAIFDLDLEMPPVSVIRVRRDGVLHWIARCDLCGQRGIPRPLLSAAMRGGYDHGRKHAAAMLRRAASTAVHTDVPHSQSSGGQLPKTNDVRLSRLKVTRKDVA